VGTLTEIMDRAIKEFNDFTRYVKRPECPTTWHVVRCTRCGCFMDTSGDYYADPAYAWAVNQPDRKYLERVLKEERGVCACGGEPEIITLVEVTSG